MYSGAGVAVPATFLASTFDAPWIRFGTASFCTLSSANPGLDTLTIPANNGRLDRSTHVEFVSATGQLPQPLQLGVRYYLRNITGGVTFSLSETEGGQVIDLTSTGSGTTNLRLGLTDLDSTIALGRSLDSTCPTWAGVNTSLGVYDWTLFDEFMTYHYTQRGRKLLYCFNQTPTWAASNAAVDAYGYPGGGQVPTDLSYAATFATAMLQRYNAVSAFNPGGARMIHAVEVWNEPSFFSPGTVSANWCGTMAQLAQLTRLLNVAVKAVDAQCKVIGPGFTAGHSFTPFGGAAASLTNWLAASDGAGGYGRDWIDGVAYHGYGIGATAQGAHEVVGRLQELRANVQAAGMSVNTPLYQTERGCNSGTGLAHARVAMVEAALGVQTSVSYTFDSYGEYPRGNPLLRAALETVRAGLCGRTLTYCAILQDGRVTCTADGMTVVV